MLPVSLLLPLFCMTATSILLSSVTANLLLYILWLPSLPLPLPILPVLTFGLLDVVCSSVCDRASFFCVAPLPHDHLSAKIADCIASDLIDVGLVIDTSFLQLAFGLYPLQGL